MKEFKKTSRGFKICGELEDRYGGSVRVQESSIAGRPCAWIFTDNEEMDNPVPHLTIANAKELVKFLQNFIEDAEDPKNWHNDPEYMEAWG